MDFTALIDSLQASGIAEWMRTNLKAMPVVEAIHVMAVAGVFGTILVVDLRLLGLTDLRRRFTQVSDELLRLTWWAFGTAVATGALMFVANAATYVANTAFRLKLLALLGAGLNMAVFQGLTLRGVARWDSGQSPPAAKLAGALSILLWIAVIVFGRWIGFTKGYDFSVPDDPNIDFEF
ncbi:MAG: hypothetical protein RL026_1062 [Pseudomonadota bacterium]